MGSEILKTHLSLQFRQLPAYQRLSSLLLQPFPLLLLQLPPSIQYHILPPPLQQSLPLILIITPSLRLCARTRPTVCRRRRR